MLNGYLDVKEIAVAALDMAEKYFNGHSDKKAFLEELSTFVDISIEELENILENNLEWY